VSKARATFRQSDVTRAAKAAMAAGLDVTRFEIEPAGKIVLFTQKPGTTLPPVEAPAGWTP